MIRKLQRLTQMNSQEIRYRLKERARQQAEHIQWARGKADQSSWLAEIMDDPRRFLQAQARFYPSCRAGSHGLSQKLVRSHPEHLDEILQAAEAIMSGRIELLGCGEVRLPFSINWHRDPYTKYLWKTQYWTAFSQVDPSGSADRKIIHELNRHQHLPRLATAYAVTGDEKYAEEIVRQLNSWIEQNPPGYGIHWQSSLEIAIRAISWLWTIFLILPARAMTSAAIGRIGRSLLLQIDHVYRYPSIYSSPNTHLIGEAAALFIAGVVFQDIHRGKQWRDFGRTILIEQLATQVGEDGVHGELSPYYHCYALDFYLQAITLADHNQIPFPAGMFRRIERMAEWLMFVTAPDGSLPLWGDDDGGRALGLTGKNYYGSFSEGLSTAATLFKRGDFKLQAGRLHAETLWLCGLKAFETWRQIPSQFPTSMAGTWRQAGYSIQRSDWTAKADHLVFDHGGLGISSGGHAHADCLSFTLTTGGRAQIVDSGTFCYGADDRSRSAFRSTAAHNTVAIDGTDQSEGHGVFSWKTRARGTLVQTRPLGRGRYWEASHDGYQRLREPLVHRRRILNCTGNYWVIADDFTGRGQHEFEWYLHFGPDVTVQRQPTAWMLHNGGRALALWMHTSRLSRAEVVPGTVSTRYGEKRKGTVFTACMSSEAPAGAIFCLMPAGIHAQIVNDYSLTSHGALAALVTCRDYRDLIVLSLDGKELEIEGFRFRGDFLWVRLRNGRIAELFARNTATLDYLGTPVEQLGGVSDVYLSNEEVCAASAE